MPASNRSNMRRYGSAGSLNSTGGYQFSAATNSINVDSRYDMAHQSNPDLINNHHRRGSSTDSMDSSSYYGNHSRQSSNEGNVDIPTRMLKSQRKTSTTSMDPLQFVKAKPSQKLAEEAEKQIQAAKEVKKVRTIIEKEDDDWYQPVDEAGEWQSNLSSWKHKRRRASAATYQRVEETDQNALEEEEKRKPKTYAQMMENREKRKSTGTMSFYPIDDDDDNDWLTKKPEKPRTKSPEPVEVFISPSRITKIESSPVTKRQPLTRKDRSSSLGSETYVKYSNEDVADWAKNDEDNGNNNKKESEEKGDNSTEIQQDNVVEDVSYKSRKPVEKNKFPRELKVDNDKESHSSSKKPWTQNNEKSVNSGFKNSSDVSMATKSTSKISNLLKSFEKKEDNVIVNSDKPKKSFEFNVESGRKRAMWQERDKGDVKAPMPRASGNYNDKYSKDEKSSKPKDFVEKNIKINQKPNNAKGFGFLITGGVDKKQPVVVQKVNIGSAADVCELEMKDQIISVNKRDISHMTQPQVQRIIDDAVKVGQIDLKVKRQVLEEEDEMDDDAFEAHPTLTDDTFKPIQSQHRSFSPVQSQHRSFSPNQSQHRSYSPVQSQQRSRSPVQSQQRSRSPVHSQHRSFSPTQQRSSPVTFQQRSSPLLRKERSSPSPLTNQQQNVSPPVPAKRPLPANRIETYDSSLTNKVEDDIESEKMWILQQLGMKTETNNNDTKPEESESESEEEEEPTQTQDFKPEIVFNKETTPTLHETPTNVETEVLERPTITRRQYQKPNRANIETIITPVAQMSIDSPPPPPREAPPPLKPSTLDVEGFKPPDILKRWQQGSRSRSDYSSSPNSLDSDSEKRLSSSSITWQNEFDNAEANNTQRNSSNDKEQSDSYQQQYDAKVGQPVMLQIDASQNSQLIIDPRNQMGYVEEPTIAQYTFHVNMPKPNEGEELHGVGERDRIKDEDQKWREEEKKRIELEEKEEQLRRQEEQIRLERERLKQEQEKIQQEKERIERRKHLESEEMSNLYNSYPGRREMNGNDRPNESVTQFSVNINTNQAMPRKLETVWAPNNNLHKEKERWSREDMLAMNRKPTPLQNKPENENMEDMPDPQVTRAAPTRQDRHNLNAVPKPRYRVSEDWKQSQKPDEQNDVPLRRKSEYVNTNSHWLVEEAERRRQQDKSKRHSVHTPFSRGPIKPVQDGLSNKWMDDTSVLHRQTYSANNSLTSPRSLSTRQFSAKPQSQLSQTLPANFNMNKIQKKEPPVPPKPVRSSPNPQSPTSPPSHAEQIMAVSGKQLCSHCNNELGFGAAMVIESLGLYYHVQCFRCCVCQTCLGNGSQGADVRVRVNKLHCRNCYSNDEDTLKKYTTE